MTDYEQDDIQDAPSPSTSSSGWKYERVPVKKKSEMTPASAIADLFKHLALMIFFVIFPIFMLAVTDWVAFSIFKNTFYAEPWMKPVVVLAGMFLAGVGCRMIMEGFFQSMGLYFVAIIGFCGYAYLCWYDIENTGSLFSARLLPEALRYSMLPYVYSLPVSGLVGMLFFKWFSLKP